LIAIGIALGGAAGARLSHRLGYGTSGSVLLYLLAKLPLPSIVTPKTLGVDDFAFRKRQSYGTILVDLDRSRPIALLSDREAESLAEWLKQHAGIEVLARDRSTSYKSGMTQGAPDAVQVADRFHLLQNLAQVLERVLATQGKALKAVDTAYRLASVSHTPKGAVRVLAFPPSSPPKLRQLAQQRRSQRLQTYNEIWALHHQGWSSGAIAQKVGVSSRTVQRYLLTTRFPERQERSDRGKSLLNPYKSYLLKQWNLGRKSVKALFADIQKQGYAGSYMTVTRYVRRLAQAQAAELRRSPTRRRLPKVVDQERPALTARRAAFLVLRRPEKLEPDDEQIIKQLTQQHPDLATAIELAQGFASLVRQRQPQKLEEWLEQAGRSHLAPFVRFAQSLREDYSAVKAGVTMTTSNGPVEGHINRLKILKRQMYGRAGIDLLSRRFLLAS
jgi:transposase